MTRDQNFSLFNQLLRRYRASMVYRSSVAFDIILVKFRTHADLPGVTLVKKLLLFLFPLLLLAGAAFVQAQSGRNRNVTPPSKSQTKSEAQPTKSEAQPSPSPEGEEGISDSRVGEEGETVEGDVVRFDTSLVTVPVTVIDRNGKYVPSLRRSDFRIYEDGTEQKIAYFATVDQPFTVVLLIDTSGSTQVKLEDIQSAAITFVDQLKPEDSVMVISFDDSIDVLTKPTTDRNAITKAIHRTRTGGGTRLYDAVSSVLKKHLRTISGRKAVVLFTDGVDTTSYGATFDGTIRLAEEADAPIYVVDYDTSGGFAGINGGWPFPGGRGTIMGIPVPRPTVTTGPVASAEDYRRANIYLHELSDRTGGRFYNGDSRAGVSQAFAQIAEELGRQYSLGYYPKTLGQVGQRRQIKVRVTQTGLVVKSRDSYIYSDKKPGPDQNNKQPYISETKTNQTTP
jgi:VWFA-related protein